MTGLCQHLSLGVLQHQTEGETLNLDATIVGAIGNLLTIVHTLEEGSGGALHGLKGIAEHRVAAVGILGHNGRGKQSDACCSGRYKLNAET